MSPATRPQDLCGSVSHPALFELKARSLVRMHIVVKKLIESGVTRLDGTIQHVSAHVDVEVLSWPGGSLIAVLLLLYASVRSKCLTG
jgi:hypothetical protein